MKPVSLFRGELVVYFSAAEIQTMAEPFELSLISNFAFGRPSMDVIQKNFISLGLKGCAQISLLDN